MDILHYLFSASTVLLLFQFIFPTKVVKPWDELKIQQNKKKYNKLNRLAFPLALLSITFICFSFYSLGIVMREAFFSGGYDYIVKPTDPYFFLCGFVLGIGLIRIPMEFVFKLILKDEYGLYIHYTNTNSGYNAEKVWYLLERIITLGGIILFILGLNWYVRIDNDKNIEINELFSLKTNTFPISEISEIEHEEKIVKRGERQDILVNYILKFTDGNEWNSNTYRFFSNDEEKVRLENNMIKLSESTGIKISYQLPKTN